MRKIIFISLILSIAGFIGCKKILTVEQRMNIPNENAITTVKDLEAALAGTYDKLQSGNVLGGNFVVYADLLADDTKVNESKLFPFGTMEIYNRQTTMQINALRDMWRDSYNVINRANNVIRAIDNHLVSGTEFEAKKNKLKGEALFIRAIVHFELLRFWAQPYNVNAPGGNVQLGIPYKTQPTLSGFDNFSMPRNTVEEVYNKAIADLQEAETLLLSTDPDISNTDASRSRPSSYACSAYLARMCFQKGDYTNAKFYAKKIIDKTSPPLDNYSLNADASLAFKMSGNNYTSEGIFQLVNISTDQSNSIVGNYWPVGNDIQLFGCDWNLRNLYSTKDSRRTRYISINPFTSTVSPKKYITNILASSLAYNVVIIRSAEMYLIHAESCALTGEDSLAIISYKALKKKRYGTNWVDEVTIPSLLDSIRLERRREMIFEGDRLHTLKRLQQPLRNGVAWNDPSVLFKIPQEEMSGNPLMIQNP